MEINLIDKKRWKTFKAEQPNTEPIVIACSYFNKITYAKLVDIGGFGTVEIGDGRTVKAKGDWLWMNAREYKRMLTKYRKDICKQLTFEDLVSIMVQKVVFKNLRVSGGEWTTLMWDGDPILNSLDTED